MGKKEWKLWLGLSKMWMTEKKYKSIFSYCPKKHAQPSLLTEFYSENKAAPFALKVLVLAVSWVRRHSRLLLLAGELPGQRLQSREESVWFLRLLQLRLATEVRRNEVHGICGAQYPVEGAETGGTICLVGGEDSTSQSRLSITKKNLQEFILSLAQRHTLNF